MNGKRDTRVPVLPTVFTLGNLLCGFIALAKCIDALVISGGAGPLDPAFGDKLLDACWFIVAAMVFDGLDGRIARLTKQESPFGAMLDSLADLVTFGVAPAFMAKITFEHGMNAMGRAYRPGWVTVLCSLYVIGAALRLARFTAEGEDEDDHDHTFAGLPSPAGAGMILSLGFFIFDGSREIGLSPDTAEAVAAWLVWALPGIASLLGLLMISRVRYVHVFQRYIGRSMRPSTFVKLVLIVWLVVLFHEWFFFLMITVYVVGGLVLGLRAAATGTSPIDSLPDPWDHDEEGHDAP